MDTLLVVIVLATATIGLFLVYYLPRRFIPDTRSSRQEDLIRTVESRNEVRKTYAQLFAGASFVVTFLLSIYNFNRDFNQKAQQSAAEQFVKTSDMIKEVDEPRWSHVNAFEIMALTARRDDSFNPAVYGTMAQFITKRSRIACETLDDRREQYEMPPELQRITQIFAGNNPPDPWGMKPNMAGACLSRSQLSQANGLQQLWLQGGRLIGAEFIGANLTNSVLDDAQGGIDLVSEWWKMNSKLVEQSGHDLVYSLFTRQRRYYWTNFSGAILHKVSGKRANLKGAVFWGASMKFSNWDGADLSFASLAGADLERAELRGKETKLHRANLKDAILMDADLAGLVLDHTNLERAFFANTGVAGADFTTALNLSSAQLAGMCINVKKSEYDPELHKPKFDKKFKDKEIPFCYSNPIARSLTLLKALFARFMFDEKFGFSISPSQSTR